jgi:hypothetical protein
MPISIVVEHTDNPSLCINHNMTHQYNIPLKVHLIEINIWDLQCPQKLLIILLICNAQLHIELRLFVFMRLILTS